MRLSGQTVMLVVLLMTLMLSWQARSHAEAKEAVASVDIWDYKFEKGENNFI